MSRADELRAELRVAVLEDDLIRFKGGEESPELDAIKHELRYARWVQRGGPAEEEGRLADGDGHTNRAVAALFERWQAEHGLHDETKMVG